MFRERMTPRQWASARLERLEDRLERLEDLSISKVIPSALTLLGLCAGLTAIRFVLLEQWKGAVIALFCAMVFDMLEGKLQPQANSMPAAEKFARSGFDVAALLEPR